MSVAPDVAPEVLIPARARRTSGSGRFRSTVSGNVISPSAFHRPLADDVDEADFPGTGSPLRLVPVEVRSALADRAPSGLAGPAAHPSVHLTARGRLLVALLALGISLGIAVGAWSSWSGGDASPSHATVPAQVVVHDGDTLWSIAAVVAPSRDPRQTVDQLRRINGLNSVALVPGQVLRTR